MSMWDDNLSRNINVLTRNGIKEVADKQEISTLISGIRDNAENVYTNFYVSDDKQISWINNHQMYVCIHESAVFIFYVRKEYVQFYFCATDLSVVEDFLCDKLQLIDIPIIIDVIYKASDDFQGLFKSLQNNGFRKHISLRRMAKVNKILKESDISNIDFAKKSDAKEILEILLQNFDVYGEQIPDIEEIEQAADNRDIIITRENNNIAAFFWTEHNGKTAYFRYWIARPEYRSVGTYGYYVYKQTLTREASARRMILWVRDDNESVIKIHQIKGFKFDGLNDDVFIRKE